MNKTVKKILIICVCVVLIAGIAGAIWFWDMNRVIESPYPEVVAIGKNKNKGGDEIAEDQRAGQALPGCEG